MRLRDAGARRNRRTATRSRRRSRARSPCCGRRGRCGASGSTSPTRSRPRSPICATSSCRCCRRSTRAGSARWARGRRASCGSAAGSAATATAIPSSTADSLRLALGRAVEAVLGHYLDEVHALGAELSISTELADVDADVASAGRRAAATTRRRARDEPYRRALTGIYARLAATYRGAHRRARRRARRRSPASPMRTRQLPRRSGRDRASLGKGGAGCWRAAGALGRLIRAVETFGFHLATLDLRQNCRRARARRRRTAQGRGRRGRLSRARRGGARRAAAPRARQRRACSPARSPTYSDETASRARHRRAPPPRRMRATARLRSPPTSSPRRESVSDLLEVNILLKEAGCSGPASRRGARSWRCRCSRRSATSSRRRA